MFKIFSAEMAFSEKKQEAGTIVDIAKDNGFIVETGNGSIFIKEVQIEGSKKMNAWDFLIGHKVKVGDILPS